MPSFFGAGIIEGEGAECEESLSSPRRDELPSRSNIISSFWLPGLEWESLCMPFMPPLDI